jgi:glycosidase
MTRSTLTLGFLALLMPAASVAQAPAPAEAPGWWSGEVCYEVFVRSFRDSDGDGVGDLRGLIEKLDYINDGDPSSSDRDLGAGCIWLMPVAQSPSYHGYDVTNHYQVNRDYGTNEDFQRLVAEAHRRGIRILVDMVLNHTSSEHPFFKDALLDPDSPYRDWYTWSPTPRSMPGWDAPTWHRNPHRDEYYYGLFWGGMPDLNLADPEVTAEVERVARFWLEEMGVDGFRLDAVAHFFEDGGQWKHAAAVHPWLRDYAAAIRRIEPDAFTVGEVWDSTGAILAYYPDQLDAYFIFEVADAIVDAARTGAGDGLVAAVERAQAGAPRGRLATFLRNHDQTRTLTDLAGDIARARLAANLLLTLPGTPFVYYGEELGMTGSKSDGDPRLRTPMQWASRPGVGFTAGTPWEPLPADSFTANVEALEPDPASLLNHYRRLIHVRKTNLALAVGDFVPLTTGRSDVLAYLRRAEGQTALVVANLGTESRSRVAVSSDGAVLPEGRYTLRPVAGAGGSSAVAVGRDGRLRSVTLAGGLAPLSVRIFELSARR